MHNQDTTVEQWRPISGWEGSYEVSDLGRIRDIKTVKGVARVRLMHGYVTSLGYHCVCLNRPGVKENKRTHIAVLEAFIGPRPDNCESCHNNGNRLDNRLCNLRWGTAKENSADRIRHGMQTRGELMNTAKLTQDDVRKIRSLFATSNFTKVALAKQFGVTPPTIRQVVSNVTWRHVE